MFLLPRKIIHIQLLKIALAALFPGFTPLRLVKNKNYYLCAHGKRNK